MISAFHAESDGLAKTPAEKKEPASATTKELLQRRGVIVAA
jgi:hypothetical protein